MIPRAGAFAVAGLIVAGGASGVTSRICLSPLLCADTLQSPARAAKPANASVSPAELTAAIGKLGAFEYSDRAKAAQVVRRAPGPMAVPALLQATGEHADGYVRYRALVLLSTYADPRVPDEMERLSSDPNDRLRAVAYAYFERHPNPAIVPQLLEAFDK